MDSPSFGILSLAGDAHLSKQLGSQKMPRSLPRVLPDQPGEIDGVGSGVRKIHGSVNKSKSPHAAIANTRAVGEFSLQLECAMRFFFSFRSCESVAPDAMPLESTHGGVSKNKNIFVAVDAEPYAGW